MGCVVEQEITDTYAAYNGDCVEVLPTLPSKSVHFSVYSPPFGGLYQYSSSTRDMSNCLTYDQFFEHYEYVVKEIQRVTLPGRLTAVHCMDVGCGTINVSSRNMPSRTGDLLDFPGDIIRLHQRLGFGFHARIAIWKEPLRVAMRTRSRGLMHKQIVKDASYSSNAGADFLLIFRNSGENKIPIAHPQGITRYAGACEVPPELLLKFKDWKDPKTNKLAHWIWQQYASSFWDDIRINRVLPYVEARDKGDEKHVHPLQLDVIDRCVTLWSNPGEVVLTPFMGVGSEVYGATTLGRKGLGVELKATYFRQALKNLRAAAAGWIDLTEQDQAEFNFGGDGLMDVDDGAAA